MQTPIVMAAHSLGQNVEEVGVGGGFILALCVVLMRFY